MPGLLKTEASAWVCFAGPDTLDGQAAQSAGVTVLAQMASRTVHLDMVSVKIEQAIAAVEGVNVNVDGQPVVSLPGNAPLRSDGEAYTGQTVISVAVVNPSEDPTVTPGDFLRWDAETQSSALIESYGAVDVTLAAETGAPLQLDGGNVAQVSIPLTQGRNPRGAPATIPLYYWSEEQGYWIEEGEARLKEVSQGSWAYVGGQIHDS